MKQEPLQAAQKFQAWQSLLASNGIVLKGVEALSEVHKSDGKLIFSLLKMDAEAPEGFKLLPVLFLRGHFVAVLTCLKNAETGEKSLLLVRQRRAATGGWFYEHPAGMMDSETDALKVVVKELEEETGLSVPAEQIHLLNAEPLYASPGASDEAGYFFYTEQELSPAEIEALHDRETGADGENEFIRTAVVSFEDAHRLIKNAMGLLHLYLYQNRNQH